MGKTFSVFLFPPNLKYLTPSLFSFYKVKAMSTICVGRDYWDAAMVGGEGKDGDAGNASQINMILHSPLHHCGNSTVTVREVSLYDSYILFTLSLSQKISH